MARRSSIARGSRMASPTCAVGVNCVKPEVMRAIRGRTTDRRHPRGSDGSPGCLAGPGNDSLDGLCRNGSGRASGWCVGPGTLAGSSLGVTPGNRREPLGQGRISPTNSLDRSLPASCSRWHSCSSPSPAGYSYFHDTRQVPPPGGDRHRRVLSRVVLDYAGAPLVIGLALMAAFSWRLSGRSLPPGRSGRNATTMTWVILVFRVLLSVLVACQLHRSVDAYFDDNR